MENRLLSDVAPDKVFYLVNGKPIRNISELISGLSSSSLEEFVHHANFEKDDFATWVEDAVGDKVLASNLRNIKNKEIYIEYLKDAITPKIESKGNHIIIPLQNKSIGNIVSTDTNKTINNIKKINKEIKIKKQPKKIIVIKEKKAKIEPVKIIDNSKDIIKLKEEIDSLLKLNSELNKKVESLAKSDSNIELQLQSVVSKSVSKYFDDKEFRKKIVEMFKEPIESVHSKDRNVLKSEINGIISMNNELEKKLDATISQRNKQIEEAIKNGVAEILNAKVTALNAKVDKIFESKVLKLESTADKKANIVASTSLSKFKNEITSEKHDLKAIATEAMNKEFNKLLSNDEHIARLVSRYQKLFSEGVEHTERTYKDFADKFRDEVESTKEKVMLESFHTLNKQLIETSKKQREVLDNELSKALSSNKFFISRFEKEVLNREKLLLESADRKLNDNYNKHNGMLNSEYIKYSQELKGLGVQFEKNVQIVEKQLFNNIATQVHASINKEFNDVIINQREELNKNINTARIDSINKINNEFNELLTNHKSFMVGEFNKSSKEQNDLRLQFVNELKNEKDKILFTVQDTMQKDLLLTINNQRNILDNELTKTVKSNKDFVERFEKNIFGINKRLHEEADKIFEEKYTKHTELLKPIYSKQVELLKKTISDADNSFASRESQIFSKLVSTINSTVRESVNKEFSSLLEEEKTALHKELEATKEFNNGMEQKFEEALREKKDEILTSIGTEATAKFEDLITIQEEKLDSELSTMKKSYEAMEDKKAEILEKANSLFNNMEKHSNEKLKSLDKECDKHLKKATKLSTLTTKAESILTEFKDVKVEINEYRKNLSKENSEFNTMINELHDLKDSLNIEKNWMSAYRTKIEAFDLVNKCYEYIRQKNISAVKTTYDKIIGIYNNTKQFDKNDRVELYKATQLLLKSIQTTFEGSIESKEI